jgi:hypothetical protein
MPWLIGIIISLTLLPYLLGTSAKEVGGAILVLLVALGIMIKITVL